MSYSDILATIAIVMSLLTAGWTAWRSWRWDRPVVTVTGQQWIGGRSDSPSMRLAGFSIDVMNTGNQSTQIIAAYWQIDRGNNVDIRFTASHGGGGIDSLFNGPHRAEVPELPFALERYGRRTWEFEMNLGGIKEPGEILRARPVIQFTSRKKKEFAYGSWQVSQVSIDARRPSKEAEL